MNDPLRVLVATKYPLLNKGLMRLINNQSDFLIVGETNIELSALQLIHQCQPDVVLIDASISIETLRILKLVPNSRLLIIGTWESGMDLFRVLAAGVDGYLSKEAEPEYLYQAIQKLADDEEISSPVLFH